MVDHVIIYLSKRKQSAFGKFCLQELKEHIKIFKLSLNLSLTHLRPQIVCYEKKRNFVLRKSFNQFENFELPTTICMENH